MEDLQSVGLLKEKLKEKDLKIHHLEAAKGENDQRVQKVLKLSQDKINELKEIVKDQSAKLQHSEAKGRESGDAATEGKAEKAQDPKLAKEVETLRSKNTELNNKINSEGQDRKRLEKEKELLVKQYKKLKDAKEGPFKKKFEEEAKKSQEAVEQITREKDQLAQEKEQLTQNIAELKQVKPTPEQDTKGAEDLKKKIGQLEKEIQESRKKSADFAKEKDDLVKSYEEKLQSAGAAAGDKGGQEPSTEADGALKAELEEIKKEKDKLEKDLANEKQSSEKKIVALEEELKAGGGGKKKKEVEKPAETDCSECDPGAPAWMCTFADMVTLLMVFFVLFFSVNTDNTAKFLSVIEGTEDKALAMGVLEALDEVKIKESLQNLTGMGPGKAQFEFQVEAEIKKDLKKAKIKGDVGRNGKKIFVNVPARNLFKPGSADLTKRAIPVLNSMAKSFAKFTEYQINIAGHTDDSIISTARFPSNWELSSGRATAVLRFFADKGIDPLLMTATGRSDLFPLYSNSTKLGRSKNRRVEFVLEKEKK